MELHELLHERCRLGVSYSVVQLTPFGFIVQNVHEFQCNNISFFIRLLQNWSNRPSLEILDNTICFIAHDFDILITKNFTWKFQFILLNFFFKIWNHTHTHTLWMGPKTCKESELRIFKSKRCCLKEWSLWTKTWVLFDLNLY